MTDIKDLSKNALIVGASGGIGSAIADELHQRSDYKNVIRESRSQTNFDITDENQVAARAEQICGTLNGQKLDLVIVATGILAPKKHGPEKSFAAISPDIIAETFAVNAFGPALVIKHFKSLLATNRRCVFAALSARVGSIGDNRLGGWMSYRSSKAALNQIIRCASVEFGRSHKESIVVALHPGTVETMLTRDHAKGRFTARADEAAQQMLSVLDNLTTKDTGGFFAYDGSEIDW
ncbi:MAG: SDR family NAD(P)-dependent oxidoreductase [Pseudomonadota bacterium]